MIKIIEGKVERKGIQSFHQPMFSNHHIPGKTGDPEGQGLILGDEESQPDPATYEGDLASCRCITSVILDPRPFTYYNITQRDSYIAIYFRAISTLIEDVYNQ